MDRFVHAWHERDNAWARAQCPITGILSSLADFPRSRNSGPFPHISGSWKGFSMYPPLRQYSKVPTRSEIVTSHPLDEPVLQLELSFIEEAKAAPLGWILDPE